MDPQTIASISMQNDLLRMNDISQNLANVLTPGYKRHISVTRSFDSFVSENAAIDPHSGNTGSSVIDPSSGTLRATKNPMDIAIEGEGFFEVTTDKGPAYTRQGALKIDTQGRLTNVLGLPLMGTGGELFTSGTSFTIDESGNVKQGTQTIGQIKVVQFSKAESLLPIGDGLFQQGAAQITNKNDASKVRGGYLENSNVSSPQEMIRLTETVRHFESMQKLMQGYDDVFQKAITKLGDF